MEVSFLIKSFLTLTFPCKIWGEISKNWSILYIQLIQLVQPFSCKFFDILNDSFNKVLSDFSSLIQYYTRFRITLKYNDKLPNSDITLELVHLLGMPRIYLHDLTFSFSIILSLQRLKKDLCDLSLLGWKQPHISEPYIKTALPVWSNIWRNVSIDGFLSLKLLLNLKKTFSPFLYKFLFLQRKMILIQKKLLLSNNNFSHFQLCIIMVLWPWPFLHKK